MKLAIIGSGASGLVASICAAKNNNDVYVFEKNSDSGKKLLLTGNGRCNYGSGKQNVKYYHSYNEELIANLINESNLEKVSSFFHELGIIAKEKNNCLYPFSEQANSIKSSLVKEALNLGVNFKYNTEVDDIVSSGNGFIVNGMYFDRVIVATGSKCAKKTGSDGWGYEIARKFNHHIYKVNPSLMQLITNTGLEKEWANKRCDVIVSHYENNKLQKSERGEIQFTNYGLSGICIFNLSRNIRIGLDRNYKENVHINFMPWLEEDALLFFDNRNKLLKNRNITELCDGFLDYRLVYVILKYIHIDPSKNWSDLSSDEKNRFVLGLTDQVIPIVDTKTFDESQTCSGGIDLREIDLHNMESKKCKNLFFVGELLDIDGDCGGFNLTIAWITGLLAGGYRD